MNEELIAQIEELGLSNKEARVYVANIMLGPSGVQQISDTSGIKRVTTYVILESLIGLGLISQTSKAKKTLFNAESPDNLTRLIDKKEQSLREQKKQLKDLLPQLSSLKTLPKDLPTVKFYEGAEGIRTIHKLFLSELSKSGENITYGISNADHVQSFFPEIATNSANPDRLILGIKSKFLYTSSRGPIYRDSDREKNRKSRFVPPDQYPIQGDISMQGNKIIILSLTGQRPSGMILESPEFAETMLSLFNLSWEASAPFNL